MTPPTTQPCTYCGNDTVSPTGLHAEVFGLLSDFYHEHHDERTWQHTHEYAARIEAVVREHLSRPDGGVSQLDRAVAEARAALAAPPLELLP